MMVVKNSSKISVWLLAAVSALALLVNWSIVSYLSTQNNPGAVHLWLPFAKYTKSAFGALACIGALSGAFAACSSKGWIALSVLNALTYVLEFVSS